MKKNIYLVLAILGVILPMSQFAQWSMVNGFDLKLMGQAMFANQIAGGIAIDALLTAVAIVVFMVFDQKQVKVKYLWLPIAGIFFSGISFALPMYLYLRERAMKKQYI
jgi:hypothetical protein